MDALFSLERLTVAYSGKAVVRSVDFDVRRNETVGLVGESGSGKSQAMLAALGLLGKSAAIRGSARLDGVELIGASERALNALRGAEATMIFQEPMSALDPLYPIGAQIAAPMVAHRRFKRAEARQRAGKLIEDVGLAGGAGRLGAYPHELSGGERQRVMIAMAIANDPALIIADEPTTALDVMVEAQILDLLARLRRRLGAALVFISHDLGLVRRFADRVYVMRDGAIVESGPSEAVLTRPKTPYARMLVAAEPSGEKLSAGPEGPVLVSARGLTVDYAERRLFARKTPRRALDGVDLELKQGRTLGVVGESGSGKSTLALALMRLVPCAGALHFEGRDLQAMSERALRPLRRRMQMIFQDPFGSLSPRMSVGAIVAEGLLAHEPRISAAERDTRAAEALEAVGLDRAARFRTPDAFSGGQRQRIAIARALILRPSLVILDEPTSSLDRSVQRAILDLLARLQASHGLTYLFISHDLAVVRAMADDAMVMRGGRVVEHGAAADIFERPKDAYTQALIKAALLSRS
jgi:oligopeptide transport system ATP-binding protein